RQALSNYYKRNDIAVEPDDIIVTTAGSEAIVFAFSAVCNYGDEIIIPEPFYTNYNGFATLAGVTIKPLTTHVENDFALPSDAEIEALITDRTKAIMICNPGNPTGAVYPRADIERLAAIARKHNLFIMSDEVYREYVYDGNTHTSIMHIPDFSENAIMVDSISKRYSACGARIGCIVSRNKELMTAVLKFGQARLCPPTLEQLAATAATSLEDEYFVPMIAEYDSRRIVVHNALKQMDGVVCGKPQGAFYIIAGLPITDAEDFAIWLLKEFRHNGKTVMIAPAGGFYATPGLGANEIRIAYVLNAEKLTEAMEIFEIGLKKYIEMKAE
ncbi:MAG: pyridoxal phosphate-dependent aminotransferase, partial [Candidatus Cloacimonetes bacterium]|nr:pyridoxal phosphate-dependent aminotransferase [Candidatus Cloacimonadota bacterium]